MNKLIRRFTLLLPFAILMVGCESTTFESGSAVETVAFEPNDDGSAANKTVEDFNTSTIESANATLTWNDTRQVEVGNEVFTEFEYSVDAGGGTHVALLLPDPDTGCSGPLVSAVPEPVLNSNANSTYEWSPGTSSIVVRFEGVVEDGLIYWSAKSPGAGGNPSASIIRGPCQSAYTLSGLVYLDNIASESDIVDPGTPGVPDDEEPGIANVEVRLREYLSNDWVVDHYTKSSSVLETYGEFSFQSIGDGLASQEIELPVKYEVSVIPTSTLPGAINESLFNLINQGAAAGPFGGPYEVLVSEEWSNLYFGFRIDAKRSIELFENGILFSDGLSRSEWYDIVSLKSKGNTPPLLNEDQVTYLLTCDGSDPLPGDDPLSPECVGSPNPNADDFGADVDLFIEEFFPFLFNISTSDDATEAALILKSANQNDDQEGLRTEILASLLNFSYGRGVCEGGLSGDVCASFDPVAMRTFVQDALVVLYNSGYRINTAKASDGSVSTSRSLLNEIN